MSFIKYISDESHYKDVLSLVAKAKRTVWIGTADVRNLVPDTPDHRSSADGTDDHAGSDQLYVRKRSESLVVRSFFRTFAANLICFEK